MSLIVTNADAEQIIILITGPHSNTSNTFIRQKSKLLTTITAELEVSCCLDCFITDFVILLVAIVVVVDGVVVVVVDVVNSMQEVSLIIIT